MMQWVGQKIMFGEMADVALIRGQRVLPKKAIEGGFAFAYSVIDDAMVAAVG